MCWNLAGTVLRAVMTKIYVYCLFDGSDNFFGAYSSLKAIHRDALKIANSGHHNVRLDIETGPMDPTLVNLRNIFKGQCDVWVKYRGGPYTAKIIKMKLKE